MKIKILAALVLLSGCAYIDRVLPPPPAPAPSPSPSATPEPVPMPEPTPYQPEHPLVLCSVPRAPECGGRQDDSETSHRWGCCIDDKHPDFPPGSPFDQVLDDAQLDLMFDRPDLFDSDGRVDLDMYMWELVWRLQKKGLCAKRGEPEDEIWIKADNGENWQFDVVLGSGEPRRHGYVAYCKPARF